MAKEVTVTVRNSSGNPQRDVRVAIEIHQFLAGGMKTEYTDSNGEADFSLDIDEHAEITIYVNGNEKVSRGSVESEYYVTI